MSLFASQFPQTSVPGVRHSTFESLRLGRSSQSIASGLLRFWDSLNFKKDIWSLWNHDSVIHGFIPAGRTDHYKLSLKVNSIVKVDRFEVARCSSMYKMIIHSSFVSSHQPLLMKSSQVLLGSIYSHD
ncbi:hypothetical protein F2Q69_00021840 [Brassica cretica]|uniref:Uncharacterized protein n=1 Tax=Brassica cretica TaxID=69181 RepID=A0A8S9QMJ2_BRACR|nr:hypothetical protein F2Q69_00021840 [Brassica cretica]